MMGFRVLRRNKDHVSPLTSKALSLPTLSITSQVLGADPGLESTPLWASPSVLLTLPAYHTVHLCSSRDGWGAGDRQPQKIQPQQGWWLHQGQEVRPDGASECHGPPRRAQQASCAHIEHSRHTPVGDHHHWNKEGPASVPSSSLPGWHLPQTVPGL